MHLKQKKHKQKRNNNKKLRQTTRRQEIDEDDDERESGGWENKSHYEVPRLTSQVKNDANGGVIVVLKV